jgi:hypothetical protein
MHQYKIQQPRFKNSFCIRKLLITISTCAILFVSFVGYSELSLAATGNKSQTTKVAQKKRIIKKSSKFKKSGASTQVSEPVSVQKINPKVWKMALNAHQKAQAMGVVHKKIVTIIDYSLPSSQRRLWVVDLTKNKVVYHTHVAHGSGSGVGKIPQRFSDRPGSLQTSLGVFVTGSTYQGKNGRSLTIHGLEKGINGNAAKRKIVVHSADYMSENFISTRGRAGHSWGCPALNKHVAQPIIQTIKEGSLIFAYYPDKKWLNASRFLI